MSKAYKLKKPIIIALIALFVVAILPSASNSLKKASETSAIEETKDVQKALIVLPTRAVISNPTPTDTVIPTPTLNPSPTSISLVSNNIIVNLSGQVYNDLNCNNIKENDEAGLKDITIAILQPKDGTILELVTTDTNGTYSFSKTIEENESLTIQPVPGVNMIYVPKEVTLDLNNKSSVIDLSSCS